MNLIRKILPILLTSILIVAIVYGFFWFKLRHSKSISHEQVIPANTVGFLSTNNFHQLSSTLRNHNSIWTNFLTYKKMESVNQHIEMIDSLSRIYPGVDALIKGRLIISLNRTANNFSLLFAVSSPEHNATEQLLKLFSTPSEIEKRKFENVTIYDIVFNDPKLLEKLSFYEHGGLLVFSPDKELLENSVRFMNSGKIITDNPGLKRLYTTTGKDANANIYINYPEAEKFTDKILRPEDAAFLHSFADWSAFDMDIKEDYFSLNGFTGTRDTLFQYLDLFKNQEAKSSSILEIIPANVEFFQLFTFSDNPTFLKKIKEHSFTGNHLIVDRDLINHEVDIQSEMREIIAGECGRLSVPGNYKYFIIKTKGKGLTVNAIKGWLHKLKDIEDNDLSSIESTYKIDRVNEVKVYKSPVLNLPAQVFGKLSGPGNYQYFTFSGNNMVFGESGEALKEFAYQNILGKTITADEYFKEMSNHFSSKSNVFLYANPSLLSGPISSALLPETALKINQNLENWKRFDAFSFQSTSAEDLHYFHVFVHFSHHLRKYVNTVWQRKLESGCSFKPAIVINHNTNEKEIFVQDKTDNIYLISNAGSILWRLHIDGPILGEVKQIDFYRNGKLQYLFNTKNKIYLLDRNGNNVESYPVSLRSPATTGLSLFDYDNNGEYRIFVPVEDLNIYLYDKYGKIISGWRFRGTDHPVNQPVSYLRSGSKDYIIARDLNRIYLLDRRGKHRVKISKHIEYSQNNPLYFIKNQIFATDTSGSVFKIELNKNVDKLFETNSGADHYFIPSDLDNNRKTEFVFASNNKLIVYDYFGKVIFSEKFPEKISFPPVIYEFSRNDKKIGVVIGKSNKIYLYNNDGSLYNGFPLQGSGMFSISSFPQLKARFNLIVGNNDNFLYNYSVQ